MAQTQQRTHPNSALIHLNSLLLITLATGCVQAQTWQTTIEQHMVTFAPPIQVTPEGKECMGLIYSADQIIMPSDCAVAAKKVMSGRSVDVLNQAGAVIGQLDIREINSRRQLLQPRPAPNRLVSFAPAETEAGTTRDFPEFFQASGSHNSTLSAPLYLWSDNPYPGSGSFQWQELQSVRKTKPGHYILPSQDKQPLYTKGSPIVDNRGRVVCLMTEAGHCQGLASTIGDDDSCQMNCLKCVDYSWDTCTNGTGVGTCKNPDSGETCDVAVFRQGDRDQPDSATCTGKAGCGLIVCPSGCEGDASNCDCAAGYGFDNDDLNDVEPDGCIDDLDNPGCDEVNSWALIGGMAALGVTAVAITSCVVCGIIYCKYRKRSKYKTLPGSR